MRALMLSSAFIIGCTLAAPASAADYSVEDLLKFFANAETARGICVGTEEECGLTERKLLVKDLTLNFEKDSDILLEPARENLAILAAALQHPSAVQIRLSIDGYTDASGTESHNLDLSQRRALSVVTFLAEQGVDTGRLNAQGFGETNPLNGNPDDPLNRRVEARLLVE
jgi:outer membrane protein OmpA-like peptidoglycan-associated protein